MTAITALGHAVTWPSVGQLLPGAGGAVISRRLTEPPHQYAAFARGEQEQRSMSEQSLEVLARKSAAAISRRRSLLTLGGAGAAVAALASPAIATAKKKKEKKCDPNKKCKQQIGQCREVLRNECERLGGDCGPEDLQKGFACCEEVGKCRFAGFFACVAKAAEDD